MKDRAAKGIGKKNLAVSLIMLVICYLIAIACMVMMIVVNAPGDWEVEVVTRYRPNSTTLYKEPRKGSLVFRVV